MKIAIISLGCPKNQVDADVFCHALLAAGHTTTADPAEADCIVVNTCAFIESAKEEAIENILEACGYKQQNPALKVVVTGCLAERYKEEIRREMPEVDAVVGIGSNEDLVKATGAGADRAPVEAYGPKSDMPLGGATGSSATPRHYAYLKIAEGCNNRCYYCAIPYIRGRLRSRPLEDCLAEARWLASEGVKELVVVAQDITAYGDDLGQKQRLPAAGRAKQGGGAASGSVCSMPTPSGSPTSLSPPWPGARRSCPIWTCPSSTATTRC